MSETDPIPWYRRHLLPSWLPEWVAVSLLVVLLACGYAIRYLV